MKRSQLETLSEKFTAERATSQEKNSLHQGYDSNITEGEEIVNIHTEETEADLKRRIFHKIEHEIIDQDKFYKPSINTFKKLYYWSKLCAAAIILITIGLGVYHFTLSKKTNQRERVSSSNPPILPGSDRATLTLSNGRKVILNSHSKSELKNQKGIDFTKTIDGELIYSAVINETPIAIEALQAYNTLTTPRGGKYKVDLPDGTRVWLNAATSLRFPISFKGAEYRSVTLDGEAYFEVKPNKSQPFIVNSIRQTVKVLGTHFNVCSYNDENTVRTTLVEGAVHVSRNNDAEYLALKPGEQITLSNNKFKIHEVDTEEAIAWKNGYFVFENDNLDGILKKLARWYDVEISYSGHQNDIKVIGSISRDTKLQDVLKTLERTEKFKFKLQGRRIVVM